MHEMKTGHTLDGNILKESAVFLYTFKLANIKGTQTFKILRIKKKRKKELPQCITEKTFIYIINETSLIKSIECQLPDACHIHSQHYNAITEVPSHNSISDHIRV